MYNSRMSIKNNQTLFIAIFILLLWIFFGIPPFWKELLTILSAIYLLIISIKITLPKRGVAKRPRKKEKITPVFTENSPIQNPTQIINNSDDISKI